MSIILTVVNFSERCFVKNLSSRSSANTDTRIERKQSKVTWIKVYGFVSFLPIFPLSTIPVDPNVLSIHSNSTIIWRCYAVTNCPSSERWKKQSETKIGQIRLDLKKLSRKTSRNPVDKKEKKIDPQILSLIHKYALLRSIWITENIL